MILSLSSLLLCMPISLASNIGPSFETTDLSNKVNEPLESSDCVNINVNCTIQTESDGFIPCTKFAEMPLEGTSCNKLVKLKVIFSTENDGSILITPSINDDKGVVQEKISKNKSYVESLDTIVSICEEPVEPILDIYVESFVEGAQSQNICGFAESVFYLPVPLKTSVPTESPYPPVNLSEPPSMQPTIDSWKEVGTVIDSSSAKDECGYSVGISSDGRKVLLGCPGSEIDGVNLAGSVQLFQLSSDAGVNDWKNLDASINGTDSKDYTGIAVAFASEADIFAVGETVGGTGRVRVFEIKETSEGISNVQIGNDIDFDFDEVIRFSIDLNGDGRRLVVGSSSQGGKVDVLDFDGTEWNIVETFEGNADDIFGTSVSLSANGDVLSVSLIETLTGIGRVNVYHTNDFLGPIDVGSFKSPSEKDEISTSISGNGLVCAVGSSQEGGTTGRVELLNVTALILGEPSQLATFPGENAGDNCGKSIDISFDGKTIAIACEGKILIATENGNGWNIVKTIQSTQSSPIPTTRMLALVTNGDPIAISGSGDTIITGSGEVLGDGQSGAQVFGNPAPFSASPSASPSNAPVFSLSPTSTGKGKGKGKGGKGGKGSKGVKNSKKPGKGGKGKKESKNSGKDKNCKKSKGKGRRDDECIGREQCNAPVESKALDVSFDVNSTSDDPIDENLFNDMLCNTTDSTTRQRRARFLNDAVEIHSIYISNVANKSEDCNTDYCIYDVDGTAFYTGDDDSSTDDIKNALTSFLSTKLTNGTYLHSDSLEVLISQNKVEVAPSSISSKDSSLAAFWAPPLAAVLIIATLIYFIQQKRRYNNHTTMISPTKGLKIKKEQYDNDGFLTLTLTPRNKDLRQKHFRNEEVSLNFPVNIDEMYDQNSSREVLLQASSFSSPVTRRSNRKKQRSRGNEWYVDLETHVQPTILYEDTVDL